MCRGFLPACCLLFTSARPFRTLPGRPRPPRQAITSIDCALRRLRPQTSRVIVLAVDNHNILVISDDDQLPFLRENSCLRRFQRGIQQPRQGRGRIGRKGNREPPTRDETRRSETASTLGCSSTGAQKRRHPWGPCCDMFNTWRQANDDTYPKSPIGKVDGDLLSHSANAAARLRVQSTLAGLNLS